MTEEQPRGGPTVRRMLVGAQLRRLRTDAGLSREQAGEAIRASAWKLHRLENGQVSFKERDLIDLLRLYGVSDADEIDTFIALAQEANRPGWWNPYSDLLPQWFRAYVDLEAVAEQIRTYEGHLVPGLLQTEEYARALMRSTLRDRRPEEIDRRVALRLTRQQVLTGERGPLVWAVVDEAALRRPVGGPKVLRAQLERLVEATSLPRVSLQVLPFAAGAHAAMVGAFSILRFADQELPDVSTWSTPPAPPTWTGPRTSRRTPTSWRASPCGAPHPTRRRSSSASCCVSSASVVAGRLDPLGALGHAPDIIPAVHI